MIKRIYIRGGSCGDAAGYVLAADRDWFAPSYRAYYLGFRIVRSFE